MDGRRLWESSDSEDAGRESADGAGHVDFGLRWSMDCLQCVRLRYSSLRARRGMCAHGHMHGCAQDPRINPIRSTRRQITALSPEEMLGIKRIAYRFFMVRARGAYAVGCTPARPKSKNKSKHYSRLSRLSLLLLGWRVGLLLTCLFYPNLAHTVAERYSCVDRVFPWMPQPRKPNC